MKAETRDLCVLTRVVDDSDLNWEERRCIVDTIEGLRAKLDFSKGVPHVLAPARAISRKVWW